MVPLDRINPSPFNPRKNFDTAELDELAASIREKGLVQPILVRPVGALGHHYEIVAGERRWRAAQRASLHLVPVIVRALTDQEALELAIIENVQRTDLNIIEEAGGYRELIDRFGYTQEELGQIIGKSRSHLANTLRLLKLPDSVQEMVRGGELSAGHARALVGRDDAEQVAKDIVDKGLNVREVEALVQDKKAGAAARATPRAATPGLQKDADTQGRRARHRRRAGPCRGDRAGQGRGGRDHHPLPLAGAVRDRAQEADGGIVRASAEPATEVSTRRNRALRRRSFPPPHSSCRYSSFMPLVHCLSL